MTEQFVYLHGFASSPKSAKAQYFQNCFSAANLSLQIPDLNCGDFCHLTLTRQINQVQALLQDLSPAPVTLIGSSFGGLTAAWLAERSCQVRRLVLLAPAFEFWQHWQLRLADQLEQWQQQPLLVYHHGERQMLPLHYQFVRDLQQYDETQIQRALPTLILHGRQDEVIPIQASRRFAERRASVNLVELESDHELIDVQEQIWREIQAFCQI
ncbi:MAG: alpha/beta fold hydrolase [Pegethrix bostrychoides GSE-TBD4-15B]|jgi:hypothetical protein|uniref:Alpha/beta fold hydrolase n=1 Tax=Pegethrix bostrychoides GSE-TBD4-15B TaxID=2839662 RepID=A0A951U4H2_9CYAN|nr:alpha/beta fold hydrolase [Pegethrix bostrychoides GSE-TBD4-15B]